MTYYIVWRGGPGQPLRATENTLLQAERNLQALKRAGAIPVARVDAHQGVLEWTGEDTEAIVADVAALLQLPAGHIFRAVRTRPLEMSVGG